MAEWLVLHERQEQPNSKLPSAMEYPLQINIGNLSTLVTMEKR